MEFTGATYEQAVAGAIKRFRVSIEALDIRVLEEGSSALFSKKPWRIDASLAHVRPRDEDKAKAAESAAPAYVPPAGEDESFSVRYTPEGVMLEAGRNVNPRELEEYIRRRGISGADAHAALAAARGARRQAFLAPPGEEPPPLNDYCAAQVAPDDMSATLIIFPGDADGKRLSITDMLTYLRDSCRIADGIDAEVLRDAVTNRRIRRAINIASGRLPVDGVDGRLDFHFETEHTGRPKIMDGDRVDYRTLDIFTSVRKGDLLITRTPATKGVEGVTLRGKAISARNGKDVRMPRGKGVQVDEEGLRMYAALDGMVNYVDGQVIVSTLFVVEKNVDLSTGNIDFAGDVEIRGNVTSGMTVKAEGNIEVQGIVEAATIIAGGDIVLRSGMQGNDKGSITAGGDVAARFFERARVTAHGAITADAVYHSEMAAAEGITLVGKHASIIGGVARSATFVAARIVGSASQAPTIVEVGVLPEQRARYSQIELELKRLEADREKLTLLATSFKQTDAELPPQRAALRDKIMNGYELTIRQLEELTNEKLELSQQMTAVTGGKVHVTGTIHPGARVVIGSESYHVEQPIDYATFRLTGGEIRFFSCEA